MERLPQRFDTSVSSMSSAKKAKELDIRSVGDIEMDDFEVDFSSHFPSDKKEDNDKVPLLSTASTIEHSDMLEQGNINPTRLNIGQSIKLWSSDELELASIKPTILCCIPNPFSSPSYATPRNVEQLVSSDIAKTGIQTLDINIAHPDFKQVFTNTMIEMNKITHGKAPKSPDTVIEMSQRVAQLFHNDKGQEKRDAAFANASGNKMELGTLLKNKTVACREYSTFLNLILAEHGIPSNVVKGTISKDSNPGDRHAWVEANIKGKDYVLDPTLFVFCEKSDYPKELGNTRMGSRGATTVTPDFAREIFRPKN